MVNTLKRIFGDWRRGSFDLEEFEHGRRFLAGGLQKRAGGAEAAVTAGLFKSEIDYKAARLKGRATTFCLLSFNGADGDVLIANIWFKNNLPTITFLLIPKSVLVVALIYFAEPFIGKFYLVRVIIFKLNRLHKLGFTFYIPAWIFVKYFKSACQ